MGPDWLSLLRGLERCEANRPGYVVLACVEGRDAERVQLRSMGLVAPEAVPRLLSARGGIGNRVHANGPGPSPPADGETGTYRPRFWIVGDEHTPEIEPLVEWWKASGDTTVLAPANGLLMTFGLVPRKVSTSGGEETHWDDIERPLRSVVVVKPVSKFTWGTHSAARVEIRADFLQDYSTLRGQSVIEVAFVEAAGTPTTSESAILGTESIKKWEVAGRTLYLRKHHEVPGQAIAQADLVRLVVNPGQAPISKGRWDYGELVWPGIPEPIKHDTDFSHLPDEAFVTDNVLAEYEGIEGFEITPGTGSVSYGIQWSVGHTRRVGRDFIAVELKKLYEGAQPDVVRHWHAHAVELSTRQVEHLQGEPHIASRTERVLNAQRRLAAALAPLATLSAKRTIAASDIIALDFADMDYRGWWNHPVAERVARHAPRTMSRDEFLSRTMDLHQLAVETLDQRVLRETLEALGDRPDAAWRSVALLRRLLHLTSVANAAGLRLDRDFAEVAKRAAEAKAEPDPVRILHALNELRNARGHRGNPDERIAKALSRAGIPLDLHAVWGQTLDAIYDGLAAELVGASATFADRVP